jgi:phosphatidylglycerophosphate synthase
MSNIDIEYKKSTSNEQTKQKALPKEDKYGDDNMFEPWSDINIFFPIAQQLIDPLYYMGFTPNMVTILSTIFTFLSIYFLHLGKRTHAFFSYIFGYILDCVDGRMARKYSMGTDIGMALDCTSDNITNGILFAYLLCNRPLNLSNIIIISSIATMSYMLSISYGINEAIASYEATGSDNFYERRKTQLGGKGCGIEYLLYQLFIFINKTSYQTYRGFFETFNKEKIFSWLNILKHFGPGNYCLFIGILLLYV